MCYSYFTVQEAAPVRPQWALRLSQLCNPTNHTRGSTARSEAWQITYFNISRYVRYHAHRFGGVDADDQSDISAQKTLELMSRVDNSEGPLTELSAERIPGFLSTVARNGLVTFLKKSGRQVNIGDDEPVRPAPPSASPAVSLESVEYARALGACVQKLATRQRTLWFFRVCYEMSSKDIASHPRVHMTAAHVDVMLHRARQAVRTCMHRRGYETKSLPPGTYAVLWQVMHPVGETKENT